MKTKVHIARKGSESLKTTVPKSIVDILGIKDGDTLKWEFEVKEGKPVACVDLFTGDSADAPSWI